jgi:hypothetical protein
MFRRIHTNSANLFHGRSPLFEICNDLILAQSMPSGAVHPNTHCRNSSWEGKLHEVMVVPNGFLWQGQIYSSLSTIALRIQQF